MSFEEGVVRFEVDVAAGYYEGALSEDGTTLEGEWNQGGLALPLALEHSDEVPELVRPQEPKPPFPYTAEDVEYANDAAGVTLAGTLTIPEGEGPFTAAILISGSGAQDRDEFILGHRPFLVLADHLTRSGVAVLRVDDRGADFELVVVARAGDGICAEPLPGEVGRLHLISRHGYRCATVEVPAALAPDGERRRIRRVALVRAGDRYQGRLALDGPARRDCDG